MRFAAHFLYLSVAVVQLTYALPALHNDPNSADVGYLGPESIETVGCTDPAPHNEE
jgi:hypothetical protein